MTKTELIAQIQARKDLTYGEAFAMLRAAGEATERKRALSNKRKLFAPDPPPTTKPLDAGSAIDALIKQGYTAAELLDALQKRGGPQPSAAPAPLSTRAFDPNHRALAGMRAQLSQTRLSAAAQDTAMRKRWAELCAQGAV